MAKFNFNEILMAKLTILTNRNKILQRNYYYNSDSQIILAQPVYVYYLPQGF